MRDTVAFPPEEPAREPIFNVPWPVTALVAVLLALHAIRQLSGFDGDVLAFTDHDLNPAGCVSLLTYQIVHANWAHVLTNAAFTLAFGTPVARYFGTGARGAAMLFLFFLLCGVFAALGFAGWAALLGAMGYPQGHWGLVGASGAASGLFAAAARLLTGRGRLGPVLNGRFVTMTIAWIVANMVLSVSGLTPGAAGARVAWEAHVFGFAAGLALAKPFALLAGVRTEHALAP